MHWNPIATHFFDRNITRPLVVLPTGTGKTVLFAALPQQNQVADWFTNYRARQRKILIIAHREELLEQAARRVSSANRSLTVEIEQGDRRARPVADVIIASVQTLVARSGKRLRNLNPDDFRIVVCDEAHHSAAKSYQRIYQHFGFVPPDGFMENPVDCSTAADWQRRRLQKWDEMHRPDGLLLGVTATPKRGDNIGLEAVFQQIVFHRSLRGMIDAGYLSRLRGIRVKSQTDLDRVHSVAGDFDLGELGEAIDNEERNTLIVSAIKKYAPSRRGVIFTVTVKHAEELALRLAASGFKAVSIAGSTPSEERRQILRRTSTQAKFSCL